MREPDLLTDLLRNVSRSFYLTLRVLPRRVRPQIGLAYLLARATDTIADTPIVPVDLRLDALEQLRSCMAGRSPAVPDLAPFLSGSGHEKAEFGQPSQLGAASAAEQLLLRRVGEAVAIMCRFPAEDLCLIRGVLDTITSGQMLDLERFGRLSPGMVLALETDADLDDYLYRVAGCVGHFWTRLCRLHLFPGAGVDETFLLGAGVRYGKGLQLTNILRDLAHDLRLGRCYMPRAQLRARGLEAEELLNSDCEPQFRPLFDRYFQIAVEHLRAGWAYTNHIPRRHMRVRLACAWPILIGMRTLERAGEGNVLSTGRSIKISRKEVRRILIQSVLAYPWPRLWRAQWREERSMK